MLSAKPVALARTRVNAAALKHLRGEIVRRGLKAGEALPESRDGVLLGVSRAPVGEAPRFHRVRNQTPCAVRGTMTRAHTELFQAIRSGLPSDAGSSAHRHATAWLSELEPSKAFAANSEEAE
jgi:DNA-binding GntR family transcriptional regulator